ncbi:cupin domain-containing protein [Nautilia sp. PV-1]|uniref:cupin domain-containing protein n=1 Tax=Nautilia sp. PV-1 TaxID=2579250 RepID=UPI000FD913A0|nr:cupin domain-containing protein [Nautilia sp. PV-1]AZV46888.1 cupin domain-containing protein [Nautilia sp. PV-1]
MDIDKTVANLEKDGYKNIFIWSDSKGTYYDWHSHPYEEIRVMLKGEMIINTKENSYRLKKGDVLKVPAGEIHEAKILEDCEYICGSKF